MDKLTPNMEDYLEKIYMIKLKNKVIRVKDISKELDVKMPSVTNALENLKNKKLINHEKYSYIELTKKGEKIAKEIRNKHFLLVKFLKNILKLPDEISEKDACNIEHYISKETFYRLSKFIEFIEICPDEDSPVWLENFEYYLNTDERIKCKFENECRKYFNSQINLPTLKNFKPGDKCTIIKIVGNKKIKNRIQDMGIVKNSVVEIIRVAPLGNPVEIKVKGYLLALRWEEAENIFVEKYEK